MINDKKYFVEAETDLFLTMIDAKTIEHRKFHNFINSSNFLIAGQCQTLSLLHG